MNLFRRFIDFFVNSLSGRLFLVFLGTSFLLVLVINAVGNSFVHERMGHHFRPHMNQYLHYIRDDVGVPPDLERAQELSDRTSSLIRIRGPDGMEWYSEGGEESFPDTLEGHRIRRRHHDLYVGSFGFVAEFNFSGYRYAFHFSDEEDEEHFNYFLWVLVIVLLVLIVGSYGVVRYQIAPLGDIRAGIQRVGEGDWDEPVKRIAMGELGELGRGINGMAERIGRMLRGKRFLLLAMSHELKTPLTSMRVNVELMEGSPEKVRLSQNIAVMEDMIGRLLLSERLSERREEESVPYDVVKGLWECREEGEEVLWRVSEGPMYVGIGEEEWRVLVRNLLKNAFCHTEEGRLCPEVELVREGGESVLRVIDDGDGVREEDLVHLGEAFYRGDSSRTRATGGTGLGLYLCRLIVEKISGKVNFLHAGEVHASEVHASEVHASEVRGSARKGLWVEVRLPLSDYGKMDEE